MTNEQIKYITKVSITNLWQRFDIEWNLFPDVNILAGINGSGKSTILNLIYDIVSRRWTMETTPKNVINRCREVVEKIEIIFSNNKFCYFDGNHPEGKLYSNISPKINLISSFDKQLNPSEAIEKLSDDKVKTDLDWEIYQLQKQYLDYQLNISKRKDEIVEKSQDVKNDIAKIRYPQNRFWEMIDTLFHATGKKVDRKKNEISFLTIDEKELSAYQLSSGEKQLIIILLTVLIQDNNYGILLMDEPEVSLHIDWQKKLIGFIRELNPNLQLIIATHSPAIIMEGWLDKVFEISDITTKDNLKVNANT